jgi:hypothetical protein
MNDFNGLASYIDLIDTDKEKFDFLIDAFYAQGTQKDSYIGNKNLPKYIKCRFKEDVFDKYLKCTKYKTCKINIFNFLRGLN